MATTKNTGNMGFGKLRNASEPLTIHLEDEPYILSEEALKKKVEAKLLRKRDWFYPKLKFISIKDNVLKLLNTHKEVSHEMTVYIEPDQLHISCSCGTQVETLCLHTYKALERLIWYRSTDYFARYRPDGIMQIGTAHEKYFDRKVTDTGLDIKPKTSLGSVYKLGDKLEGLSFTDVMNLPQAAPQRIQGREAGITYILMNAFRNRYLTFLFPCLGVLNKAGTDVKGFHHFISDTQKEYDTLLTDEQRALNIICLEMWQQTEKQSGSLIEGEPEKERSPIGIFSLWEKAMPLLLQQEFIYRYSLYGKRELKEKPSRGRIERISLLKDTPRLHFQLLDKGAFYQLQMKVTIRDKKVNKYNAETTFFIGEDKKLYLLASLKDAGVVQWMQKSGGYITIFKEHFSAFEQEYLNSLRECYSVNTVKGYK
ncbi:hypothetical protein [Chitinophaga cymbidii]|uniref:SWIM-type domain-containing protein n=1 Tax=Chitinophaga cymbidii TaxID=1096750 RepID=A0A512RQ05_9BACT|nr:hypothetical protein [Chitinophaga cymbidii]GEP97764.1 hypothetical protein CCY01nite_40240 [Chitinophaga cymbidii]